MESLVLSSSCNAVPWTITSTSGHCFPCLTQGPCRKAMAVVSLRVSCFLRIRLAKDLRLCEKYSSGSAVRRARVGDSGRNQPPGRVQGSGLPCSRGLTVPQDDTAGVRDRQARRRSTYARRSAVWQTVVVWSSMSRTTDRLHQPLTYGAGHDIDPIDPACQILICDVTVAVGHDALESGPSAVAIDLPTLF